jgi:hypothetical protein
MSQEGFSEHLRVGDVFNILLGIRFAREIDDKNGIPVIRGRDLARKDLSKEDLQRFRMEGDIPPHCFAKESDILIQRIGDQPKAFLVPTGWEDCLCGDTVLILRAKLPTVSARAVHQYLDSPQGRQSLVSTCARMTVPTLSTRAIAGVVVPVLPLDLSVRLEEAGKREREIRLLADELRTKREKVFASTGHEEIERAILDLEVSQVVLRDGMSRTDDLSFRLRNFYPLPLAYPYRLVDAEHEPIRIVKLTYQNAEGVMSFVASLAMALSDRPSGKIRKTVLHAWGGKGATFGNWFTVGETLSVNLDPTASSLHAHLRNLIGTPEGKTRFGMAMQWLLDRRDDFHHRDLPVGPETEQLITHLKARLETCFAELSFLLPYELILVQDYDAIRHSERVRASCLVYSGDHPGCRRISKEYAGPLKKGDLYLVVSDEKWIPLYPFVAVLHCPRCKMRETYFIEAWSPKNTAKLKSFERGHTEESQGIAEELSAWLAGESAD